MAPDAEARAEQWVHSCRGAGTLRTENPYLQLVLPPGHDAHTDDAQRLANAWEKGWDRADRHCFWLDPAKMLKALLR